MLHGPDEWQLLRMRCELVSRAKPVLTVGNRLLKILGISFDIMPMEYLASLHAHSYYELIILVDGTAVYMHGEHEVALPSGSILVFAPRMKHTWHPADGPCTTFVVNFSMEPSIEIPVPERWPISPGIAGEAERLGRELLVAHQQRLVVASSHVTGIVGQALDDLSPQAPLPAPGERERDLVEIILHMLAQDMARRLTLDDISAQVGICTRHLTRTFRQATGVPIGQFIIQTRLNQARSLLRESDAKIAEIGARVGLPNQGYFYRAFRRYFGMTPDEYRQVAKMAGMVHV